MAASGVTVQKGAGHSLKMFHFNAPERPNIPLPRCGPGRERLKVNAATKRRHGGQGLLLGTKMRKAAKTGLKTRSKSGLEAEFFSWPRSPSYTPPYLKQRMLRTAGSKTASTGGRQQTKIASVYWGAGAGALLFCPSCLSRKKMSAPHRTCRPLVASTDRHSSLGP